MEGLIGRPVSDQHQWAGKWCYQIMRAHTSDKLTTLTAWRNSHENNRQVVQSDTLCTPMPV